MSGINSKQEFYALSKQLLLGNRLNQWDWPTFDRLFHEGFRFPKVIGLRQTNGALRPGTSRQTPAFAHGFAHRHVTPDTLIFDEGADEPNMVIQGELMISERFLDMRYSFKSHHMRKLFEMYRDIPLSELRATGLVRHISGLRALLLLKAHFDAPSMDCLNDILNQYERHRTVVEFAAFNRGVGVLGWNTLFWEVRTGY